MYTSGRTVKSKVRKPTTTASATREARRIVERIMPGVGATVNSRISWDLTADCEIVETTVTFPRMHAQISNLRAALHSLPGIRDMKTECSSITYTRTV